MLDRHGPKLVEPLHLGDPLALERVGLLDEPGRLEARLLDQPLGLGGRLRGHLLGTRLRGFDHLTGPLLRRPHQAGRLALRVLTQVDGHDLRVLAELRHLCVHLLAKVVGLGLRLLTERRGLRRRFLAHPHGLQLGMAQDRGDVRPELLIADLPALAVAPLLLECLGRLQCPDLRLFEVLQQRGDVFVDLAAVVAAVLQSELHRAVCIVAGHPASLQVRAPCNPGLGLARVSGVWK